ncbi:MAG TPA: glycosyltransferase [Actinomycetota bacterium]|nr:glycosyltransferase [Actinomycetota bacterium]
MRGTVCDVVVITRDRVETLLRTLANLTRLDDRGRIIVVDNASTDATAELVAERFPDVSFIRLGRNHGAAARNGGVGASHAPFVALTDDDSWWAPGALEQAARALERYPRLGLVAARVLVGPKNVPDPTNALMEEALVGADGGLPGRAVLGFVACGAIVRREAFLEVGGFQQRYGIGGEEQLLAIDLAARGWGVRYLRDVVVHHHPAAGNRDGRRRRIVRNDLWTAWLRRPLPAAISRTTRILASSPTDADTWRGLAGAIRGLPWVVADRRVVPPSVERHLRALDRAAARRGRSTRHRIEAATDGAG